MSATTLSYVVAGMTCGHCSQSVTEEVATVPGVQEVDVDLTTGWVTVNGEGIDDVAVRAAIDDAGYQVAGQAA